MRPPAREAKIISAPQSAGFPISRSRRVAIAPAARKPRANMSPKVLSGRPRTSISGCIRPGGCHPAPAGAYERRAEAARGRRPLEVPHRVDDRAVDADLEVEVVAEAAPRASAVADDLPLRHARTHRRREARLVRV